MRDQVKPETAAVEARELVVTRNGDAALAAPTFAVPCGAVTAVVGPNGSGKTTVLHAIAGLLAPTAGDLRVLGGAPTENRERVAYVPRPPGPRRHPHHCSRGGHARPVRPGACSGASRSTTAASCRRPWNVLRS